MQIQLSAPKIWLANEAVDFRKAADGLTEIVLRHFPKGLEDHIFIFYNRARDKLKLLAYHHKGDILLYKRLHKKKFTINKNQAGYVEVSERKLSWLLAGLNWVDMSDIQGVSFNDYF